MIQQYMMCQNEAVTLTSFTQSARISRVTDARVVALLRAKLLTCCSVLARRLSTGICKESHC